MTLPPDQVPGVASRVLAMREREQARLERISAYMRGRHDSVYVPHGAKNGVPVAPPPHASSTSSPSSSRSSRENLHVDGYLPTNPEGEVTDPAAAGSDTAKADPANPWSIWHANRMQARQHGLHRAVAKYGIGYTVVLPGTMQGPGGETVDQPVIRAVSPRRITALYADDVDDEWPVYAVEERTLRNDKGAIRTVLLYDDQNRYTLVGKQDDPRLFWADQAGDLLGAGWEDIPSGMPTIEEHGLGVCPVVRFLHEIDLDGEMDVSGEAEPLIPLQDQINTTTFNLLMAQQYAAFRQRWVTGMVPDDEDGRPREPFRAGVDRLWVAEDTDTKFGEFSATDLGGFLEAREASIRHMSTIAQVPPYHLLGAVANLPLALDTPVLTPLGRKMMGSLNRGDEVFAPDGSVVKVKALSPVFHDHDCYRVVFDDGTEIVADAQHRWETTHFKDPQRPYWPAGVHHTDRAAKNVRETSVVTTQQIAETLRTSMGTFNHYIPTAKPWDGPEQEFLIPPYVLGVFLGDGDRVHGTITSHKDDAEETAEHLRACGEIVDVRPYADGSDRRIINIRHDWSRCPYGHERPRGTHDDTARCVECRRIQQRVVRVTPPRVNASFQWRLAELGLRRAKARGNGRAHEGGKHIPEQYFQGSLKQRLALLQGVMDTDGSVDPRHGNAAITLHHERLAKDVYRLICSVGHKAALRESTWKSSQLGMTGTCWRITWSAIDPVFRLARKADRQRTEFLRLGEGKGRAGRLTAGSSPLASPWNPSRCGASRWTPKRTSSVQQTHWWPAATVPRRSRQLVTGSTGRSPSPRGCCPSRGSRRSASPASPRATKPRGTTGPAPSYGGTPPPARSRLPLTRSGRSRRCSASPRRNYGPASPGVTLKRWPGGSRSPSLRARWLN